MRCLRVFPTCRPVLTLGPLSHPLRFCFHTVSVFPDLPSLRVMPWDTSLLAKDHRSSFYQAFWQPPISIHEKSVSMFQPEEKIGGGTLLPKLTLIKRIDE